MAYVEYVQSKYLDRPRELPGLDEEEAAHNVEELVLWILHSSDARYREQKALEKKLDKEGSEYTRSVLAHAFLPLARAALREYRAAIERGFRVSLDDVAWVMAGMYLEGHRRGK